MPDQRQHQQSPHSQHDSNGNGSATATERSSLLMPKPMPLREVSSTESQVGRLEGGREEAGQKEGVALQAYGCELQTLLQ